MDLDDVTIIVDRLGRKIKKMMAEAKIEETTKMYAFCSKPSENILNNCKKVGFKFFEKPTNQID